MRTAAPGRRAMRWSQWQAGGPALVTRLARATLVLPISAGNLVLVSALGEVERLLHTGSREQSPKKQR